MNDSNAQDANPSPLDALFGNSATSISNRMNNPLDALFGKSSSHSEASSDATDIELSIPNSPLDSLFSKPSDDVNFCKDCRYFITHPFECRCSLTGNVISPTDDCKLFSRHDDRPVDADNTKKTHEPS